MSPRKKIGAIAFGLLLLLGLGVRYGAGIAQDEWNLIWALAYVVSLCIAFVAAFYDRKNFPKKTWDFNPKRGVFYFVMGWIIFPLMMMVNSISGTEFTLSGMLIATFFMSVAVGVAGTFTENVGV